MDELSINTQNSSKSLNKIIKRLEKRSPVFIKNCHNCEAIAICGNGCAYEAWIRTGNKMNIDEQACKYAKYFYKKFIYDLYKLTKNKHQNKAFFCPSSRDRKMLFGNVTIDKGNLNSSIGHETNT